MLAQYSSTASMPYTSPTMAAANSMARQQRSTRCNGSRMKSGARCPSFSTVASDVAWTCSKPLRLAPTWLPEGARSSTAWRSTAGKACKRYSNHSNRNCASSGSSAALPCSRIFATPRYCTARLAHSHPADGKPDARKWGAFLPVKSQSAGCPFATVSSAPAHKGLPTWHPLPLAAAPRDRTRRRCVAVRPGSPASPAARHNCAVRWPAAP